MTAQHQSAARSFRDEKLTLDEARQYNGNVDRAIRNATLKLNKSAEAFEGMWAVLQAQPYDDDLAMQVEITMPPECSLLVSTDEVARGYAMTCLLDALCFGPTNLDGDDLKIRLALNQGWQAFEKRRRVANAIQEGFGVDESQSWQTLRSTADRPSVERKMKKIADLAGAMTQALSIVGRVTKTDDPHGVNGAELGGDPARLLPAELAKLADADLGNVQTMKVIKRRAHQRKMVGERKLARGPLVIMVDESGSMHDEGAYAGRNTWAKACAIALTRVAHAEDRHVSVVHFGDAAISQVVPKNDGRAMFELANSFLSGGTNMNRALLRALREVEKLETEGVKGADVVLISDGEIGHRAYEEVGQTLDAFEEKGIKLWTTAVGVEFGEENPTRARAALYIRAKDGSLGDKAKAGEIAKDLSQAARAREGKN